MNCNWKLKTLPYILWNGLDIYSINKIWSTNWFPSYGFKRIIYTRASIIRVMELIIWRQTLIIFRHERHWSGTFGNKLVQWTTTIAIVTVTCTDRNIYFWDSLWAIDCTFSWEENGNIVSKISYNRYITIEIY